MHTRIRRIGAADADTSRRLSRFPSAACCAFLQSSRCWMGWIDASPLARPPTQWTPVMRCVAFAAAHRSLSIWIRGWTCLLFDSIVDAASAANPISIGFFHSAKGVITRLICCGVTRALPPQPAADWINAFSLCVTAFSKYGAKWACERLIIFYFIFNIWPVSLQFHNE